jgi:hypothetical protein
MKDKFTNYARFVGISELMTSAPPFGVMLRRKKLKKAFDSIETALSSSPLRESGYGALLTIIEIVKENDRLDALDADAAINKYGRRLRAQKNATKGVVRNREIQARRWAGEGLEFAKRHMAANPECSRAELARQVVAEIGRGKNAAPDARQVVAVIEKWEDAGDLVFSRRSSRKVQAT